MIEPPLARCYEALYSPERREFHLLLDDLSETHLQLQWPLPPLKLQCEQIIDALAKFHAYWWEHPRLGKDIGEVFDEESLRDRIRETEKRGSYFMDFLGDRLSVERRKLYEKVLSSLPRLWKHLSDVKGLTIIHGDAHVWNFLYPRDPNKDKVRIIDWDSWTIGLGPSDLAYMMALHWYPERRHSMEENLLLQIS